MVERSFLARWFLGGGATLAVLGLILWKTLPVPLTFPPYLATALLALIYGTVCWFGSRSGRNRKP